VLTPALGYFTATTPSPNPNFGLPQEGVKKPSALCTQRQRAYRRQAPFLRRNELLRLFAANQFRYRANLPTFLNAG
jgi:hypothetical protein